MQQKLSLTRISNIVAALFLILPICFTTGKAQVASGGTYSLDQAVIASGGGLSADAGNQFSVTGTIGQPAAGTQSSGGNFIAKGGFWTSPPAPPTAAGVPISGRILTPEGNGLRNARVILTDSQGNTRMAVSGTFGYFSFAEVPVGDTYIISVVSKRFIFAPQFLAVTGELTGLNFIASGENQINQKDALPQMR